MGIEEVAGWLLIVNGAIGVGPVLPVLASGANAGPGPGASAEPSSAVYSELAPRRLAF